MSRAPAQVEVPAEVLRLTSTFLRSMTGVEACCFWFGRSQPAGMTVEGIVIPQQQNNQGHYHITAPSMVQVANVARPRGWKNLAQIHSHPGTMVKHSGYDDEMANSRKALSIIYPSYGFVPGIWKFRNWLWRVWPTAFPREIGVHAFINGQWSYLDQAQLAQVLRVTAQAKPVVIDLRQ